MSAERRRHVRVKPLAELPARAALPSSGLVREGVEVHDVSAGGLLLGSRAVASTPVGDTIALELDIGTYGLHVVKIVVRWSKGEMVGVEIADPESEGAQAVRKYVAELLERGAAS